MSGAMELSMPLLEKFIRNVQIPATGQALNPPFAHSDVVTVSLPGGTSVSVDYLVFVDALQLGIPLGDTNDVLSVSFRFSRTSAQVAGIVTAGPNPMLAGLSGTVSVKVPLTFVPVAAGLVGRSFVQLTADMPNSSVDVDLDPEGEQALADTSGGHVDAATAESMLERVLEGWLASSSVSPVGPPLQLTGGGPSTGMTSVARAPEVEFLRAPDRLRLSLQYTPTAKPPVPDSSLLPAASDGVGVALTAEGFADSAKRQIIRGMVYERVFTRRYDRLLKIYQDGGVTPSDPDMTLAQMVASAVAGSLETNEGQRELAASTPGPVGQGSLVERVNPPDPFGPFDLHISSLDLFLAEGRIVGEARGRGEVIGFDLDAKMRFSVTPSVDPLTGQLVLKDPIIDDPEISIDLGALGWAFGLLVNALSTFVFGVLAVIGIDVLADELAEVFAADQVRDQVRENLGASFAAGVPDRMRLSGVRVSPTLLHLTGTWSVPVKSSSVDGRMHIDMTCKRRRALAGGSPPKTVFVGCRGELGILGASQDGPGEPFTYQVSEAPSDGTAALRSTHIPLPLRDVSWTISVSPYRPSSPHSGGGGSGPVPLSPGVVPFSTRTWTPDPPFFGRDVDAEFEVDVSGGPREWQFTVARGASSVRLSLSVTAVDHSGITWSASANEIVSNRWISWGESTARLEEMRRECANKRDIRKGVNPEVESDPLSPIWNPPPVDEWLDLGRDLRPRPGDRSKLAEQRGVQAAVRAVAARRRMV